MKRKIVFSRKSEADLLSLYDYIAEQSGIERAYFYAERIREFCLTLQTFPERGTAWGDVVRGIRVVGFERRVSIAFLVAEDRVTIVRVLYGGRDLSRALKEK